MEVVAVVGGVVATVNTVLDVVGRIYNICTIVPDAKVRVRTACQRAEDLLKTIKSMDEKDVAPLQANLHKFAAAADALCKDLGEYSKHSITKVFRLSGLMAKVTQFDQTVAALAVEYQLATGAFLLGHNRRQSAVNDDLIRGMRELLQGGGRPAAPAKDEEILSSTNRQTHGPVAKAQQEGNSAELVKFLSESKDALEVEQAAIALCENAEAAGGELTKAVMQSLVGMLHPKPKPLTCVTAAHVLHRLAGRGLLKEIVKSNIIQGLAYVLHAKGVTEAEISAACAALSRLTTNPEHKKAFLKTDGLLQRLIDLVHTGSARQKLFVTRTLRELATNDDECVLRIADLGAIPVLVDLLYVGDTAETRFEALDALWNLASLEKNRTEIADEGAIRAIVAQIRNGDTDEHCRLSASMLAVLAQDDENDQKVANAQGIRPLVELLASGTAEQRNSATWAIAELADHPGNAATMVKVGAARALVASFRSATDMQRRSNAGLALTRIARLVKDKTALVDEIGLKSVVGLLHKSRSIDQKQNAAGFLSGIADDSNIKCELRKLGAIKLLIEFVKHNSPKDLGIDALRALAKNDEQNQAQIRDSGGIEVFLEVVLTAKDAGGSQQATSCVGAAEALKEVTRTIELKRTLIGFQLRSNSVLKILISAETLKRSLPHQRVVICLVAGLVEALQSNDDAEVLDAYTSRFVDLVQKPHGLSQDDQLMAEVAYTIAWLSVGKVKGYLPSLHPPGFVPKLCELTVRLLKNCAVRDRTVLTMRLLASQLDIAEQLGRCGGVDALVRIVKELPSDLIPCAMHSLILMSNVPDNIQMLKRIGAIKAISFVWRDHESIEHVQLASELLSRMFSEWKTLRVETKESVVTSSVALLNCKREKGRPQLGLTILEHIHEDLNGQSTDEGGHDDNATTDAHSRTFRMEDFFNHLKKADGAAAALLNSLQWVKQGQRAPVLIFLSALGKNCSRYPILRKIGASTMTDLVGILRDGEPAESEAAAMAVATFLTSSENTTRAIGTGVISAFQTFLKAASVEDQAKVNCSKELLSNLWSFREKKKKPSTLAATGEVKAMFKFIAVLAVSAGENAGCEAAFQVVKDLLHKFVKALGKADLVKLCVDALKLTYGKTQHDAQFQRVCSICVAQIELSPTDDSLLKTFESQKRGERACLIKLFNAVAHANQDFEHAAVQRKFFGELVFVVSDGTEDERLAAADTVLTLIDTDSETVQHFVTYDPDYDICVPFIELLKTYPEREVAMGRVKRLLTILQKFHKIEALKYMTDSLLKLVQNPGEDERSDAACAILVDFIRISTSKYSDKVTAVAIVACYKVLDRAGNEDCHVDTKLLNRVFSILEGLDERDRLDRFDEMFLLNRLVTLLELIAPQVPLGHARISMLATMVKRKVETSIHVLVDRIRNGSGDEQMKVAQKLLDLMSTSENAAIAVDAGVVDKFAQLCSAENETYEWAESFLSVTPASFVSALLSLAFESSEEGRQRHEARKRATKALELVFERDEKMVALVMCPCMKVLKEACQNELQRASPRACNALDIVCKGMKSKKHGERIVNHVVDTFLESGYIQPLVNMIQHKTEQFERVEVLQMLCEAHPMVVKQLGQVEFLDACAAIMIRKKKSNVQKFAFSLVVKIAKDDEVGPHVAQHSKIVALIVNKLVKAKDRQRSNGTDRMAVQIAGILVRHDEARLNPELHDVYSTFASS